MPVSRRLIATFAFSCVSLFVGAAQAHAITLYNGPWPDKDECRYQRNEQINHRAEPSADGIGECTYYRNGADGKGPGWYFTIQWP